MEHFRWAVVALRSFLMFVFGLCATVFLTEVGKISSGVLRPNFIDLCDPNVTCAGRDPGRIAFQCCIETIGYQESGACLPTLN